MCAAGGAVVPAKLVGRRPVAVVDIEIIASPAALEGVGAGGSAGRGRDTSPSGLLSQNSPLQPRQ